MSDAETITKPQKSLCSETSETGLERVFIFTHLPIGLKNIPIPCLKSLSFWQFVMSNKFAGLGYRSL